VSEVLLIAGTVPIEDLPLTTGEVSEEGDFVVIKGHRVPCTQGTGAMISAALATTSYLGVEVPQALVAGDTGQGKGSREIYQYLIENIAGISPAVLALHYCLPYVTLMKRLCQAVDKGAKKPVMIADAASMYAAKASGMAEAFDIFTPDATEMAFLADPYATHPAYINKHLFDTDITQTPRLIEDAYRNKSAARLLLVKGSTDYVIRDGEILDTISEPNIPALEAIGGTGDTITGLVAAFVSAELELHEAAILAARSNRMAGKYAKATPATRIKQVIAQFPNVFRDYLCQWSGVCFTEGANEDD
jgi:NAD(P)H-hydrate repair Nnr-like enzyme with NAD(P)H-hydrate dehydratase domain